LKPLTLSGAALLVRRAALRRPVVDLRDAVTLLAVGALYYATARIGLLLQFEHTNVTPVWPPSGIAVGALLLLGRRQWPALTVAAFLANITTGLSVLVSAAIAAGNTGEYVVAAELLRRAGFRRDLGRIADVMMLTVLGGAISPVIAATVGMTTLWLGGVAPASTLSTVWRTWWIGDGIGIVVFTPALFEVIRLLMRMPSRVSIRRGLEAASLMAVTAAVAGAVFLGRAHYPYLMFPVAIWAAVRFMQRGATAVTCTVSLLAISGTVHGTGPFASGDLNDSLIDLQVFTAAFSVTVMVLAAATSTRRQLEEGTRERTRQLELMNQELEAFTYTVSHDLRAPVRAIDGFSLALTEGEAAKLSDEGRGHLAAIVRNSQHMTRLIDALLDFSRLGRQPLHRQWADTTAVAKSVAERLRQDAGARVIDISIDEMPPCWLDPRLLEQIYANLIGNAVKFTERRERAVIHVGAQQSAAGQAEYFVRDNGVGFDMEYASQLFGLFRRLHGQNEFPGTGAGLAIVHRIVERHDGRVWAEGTPGIGATFHFTISGDPRHARGDRRRRTQNGSSARP